MVAPIGGGFGAGMNSISGAQGAAGGASALGGAGGAAGSPEELQKALEELTKLLQMLMEILKNMGLAGPDAKAPAAPVGAAGGAGGAPQAAQAANGGGGGGGGDGMDAGGAGGGGGVQNAGQTTPTGPAVNIAGLQVDPSLAPALEAIANHPDGAKLLEAAKANGLTSIGVNSNLNPGGGAGTEGLFNPNTNSIEIANPNSPNLIHVLAHELGHAATKGDGNSLMEEQTVDALGERIHRDLTGGPSNFNLDIGSYNLQQDNGIRNSLSGLGIRV